MHFECGVAGVAPSGASCGPLGGKAGPFLNTGRFCSGVSGTQPSRWNPRQWGRERLASRRGRQTAPFPVFDSRQGYYSNRAVRRLRRVLDGGGVRWWSGNPGLFERVDGQQPVPQVFDLHPVRVAIHISPVAPEALPTASHSTSAVCSKYRPQLESGWPRPKPGRTPGSLRPDADTNSPANPGDRPCP